MTHISVMPYDVEARRQDFPILHQQHHEGVPLIYLDNAASSQKPVSVLEAMNDYYRRINANVHRGIHKLSEEATQAYEGARRKVQRFINASNHREVIFTRGTTESINLVAQTWGRANLQPNDIVVSTVMEHHANIVPWQMLSSEKGFSLCYVPLLPNGTLDLKAYEALLLTRRVKLVVVTHCSNVLGTINPIAQMAKIAHAYGALILVDGAQSTPHMPIDVQAMDVDFFAFSSHKMMGPTGIGVLYGKRALLEAMPPWMGGGDMISRVTLEKSTWNQLPYKFEAGTPSIAEAIGLGAAIDYLNAIGMESIQDYTERLTLYALRRLHEMPQVTIFGSALHRGSLISFTIDGIHAHDAAQILDHAGIAVRAGHHCAMPLHQILSVSATVRVSFALYNTFEEVNALVASIHRAIELYSV
jgi:cysteine desulfurase / selenocysteine lyase